MKTPLHSLQHLLLVVGLCGITINLAAQGTAFTYQGRLEADGVPYTGQAEMQFGLWDAVSGGSRFGDTLTLAPVGVTNGLFSVSLDFGAAVFTGADRWLEIAVRTNLLTFTTLSPRQPVTPTPYAMLADNVSGVIANSSLPANPSFSGTVTANGFAGNGAGLTNLNASHLTSGTVPNAHLPASVSQLGQSIESSEIADGTIQSADLDGPSFNEYFWGVAGNTLGGASGVPFLGTKDTAALEIRVNNRAALRLIPTGVNTPNLVGGYSGNIVSNGAFGSVIGGGGDAASFNRVGASFATVVGGAGNIASGHGSTAMGIYATASGLAATAMGEDCIASGSFSIAAGNSTVANGWSATAMGNNTTASGQAATALGQSTTASGWAATAIGEDTQAMGYFTFAAGRRAKAVHTGSFVWCDSLDQDGASQGNNTFTVRAAGGTYFFSSSGNTGVRLPANSGSWSSLSDRASKTNFAPVNHQEVLERLAAIPIQSWNYIAQAERVRHLGPTAQDFQAAFGLGEDDQHIATVDADGVALAAIQGLNQKLQQRESEIAELKQELAEIKRMLSGLVRNEN